MTATADETRLLTPDLRDRLVENGLNKDRDHIPVIKLFVPDGAATWLITEIDPDDPNLLFGLCDLGLGCPELGYVSLTELLTVRRRLGLPIERDLYFRADKPLSAYADEARIKGRIVT